MHIKSIDFSAFLYGDIWLKRNRLSMKDPLLIRISKRARDTKELLLYEQNVKAFVNSSPSAPTKDSSLKTDKVVSNL